MKAFVSIQLKCSRPVRLVSRCWSHSSNVHGSF